MLRPTLVTPATPLTLVNLAEAKQFCRVDHVDDDATISVLINAAETYLDGYSGILGRALLNQSWSQVLCEFCDRMSLKVGIASSITSITYYDTSNAVQTLATSVYQVLTDALGSYVALKAGQSWPSTYSRADAVTITWIAGYGATSADVPAAIKLAMLHMIEANYDGRGEGELPATASSLLVPFRRVGV